MSVLAALWTRIRARRALGDPSRAEVGRRKRSLREERRELRGDGWPQVELSELVDRDEVDRVDRGVARGCFVGRRDGVREKRDVHDMLGAIRSDRVADEQKAIDGDLKPDLFLDLPDERLRKRFAPRDSSARKQPVRPIRFVLSYEQEAGSDRYGCGNAYAGRFRRRCCQNPPPLARSRPTRRSRRGQLGRRAV